MLCVHVSVPRTQSYTQFQHTLSPLRSPPTVIIADINSTMLWRVLLFSLVVLQCLCNGAQTFPVIVREQPREGWGGVGVSGQSLTERAARISGTHTLAHAQIHTRTDWLADKLLEADQCEQEEGEIHWYATRKHIWTQTHGHTLTHSLPGVFMCVGGLTDQGRPIFAASIMRSTPDAVRQFDWGW